MPKRLNLQPQSRRSLFSLSAVVALIVFGTLAYSNSLQGPFVFDDLDEIAQNPHVQITTLGWSELRDAAWRSPSARRPVANVTFALNHFAGRLRTSGYHVVNLAIHLACGVLVYLFGRATFSRTAALGNQARSPAAVEWMSLAAALVFVCHPVQIQAVTYVVQRMTSLATLFYLGALLLYIQGRTVTQPRRRWCLWGGAGVCWLAAMGTKEIAATWPLAVLFYEWFFFQDLSRDWLKRCLAILVPVSAMALLVVWLAGGDRVGEALFGSYALRPFTMGERVLTEFRVLVFYLSLAVWPVPGRLSLTHDFTVSRGLFDPATTALSLACLLGLLAVAVAAARRYRLVSFCILWFFLHLAMESTVIPLELAYEHRMYLPMVGLSLLAAWGLFAYLPGTAKALTATTGIVLLLALATHSRNRDWQDARTLWADVAAKYPQDARAQSNLGQVLAEAGNYTQALRHFEEAIALKPDYAEAYYNVAVTKAAQGIFSEAIANYRRAAEVDPTYFPAHNNLGALLASQGDEVGAAEHFRRALEVNPEFAPAHNNLGNALASQGKNVEAIAHYRRALELESRIADAHFSLGNLLAESGNYAEADGHLRRALELARTQGNRMLIRDIEAALRALPHDNP